MTRNPCSVLGALVFGNTLCLCLVAGWAQEQPQFPGPEKEHAFLKRFVGQWETISECIVGPGQPPMKCEGSIDSKMLGEFWVLNQTEGTMAETTVTALQTLGYDPQKKKYIGTWVDSMVNHMWKSEGTVDGSTLTLEAEGPNFMAAGKLAKFRDIYEFKSANEIALSSSILGEDGKWITFVTGTAKRKSVDPSTR